jgi:2-polyprenyl-3-methyl-5-hydroxy-6-metoxy-1,4-benzoquinol methylase
MKPLDRFLQNWRIDVVAPHLKPADHILDIGSFDGALARRVKTFGGYVGIDPEADPARSHGDVRLIRGVFPDDFAERRQFDVITMLAVLEHVPAERLAAFAVACAERLKPGGRLLLTVPHPFVDRILDVLTFLKILDGMETEAHHGFDVERTGAVFAAAGFRLTERRRFQLGLNNFFAFQKSL